MVEMATRPLAEKDGYSTLCDIELLSGRVRDPNTEETYLGR